MIYGLFAPTIVTSEQARNPLGTVRTFLTSIKDDEEKAFVSMGKVGFDATVAREAGKFYPDAHLQLVVPSGAKDFDASLKRVGEKLIAPALGTAAASIAEAERIAVCVPDEVVFFMETKQFAKSELADMLTMAKEFAPGRGINVRTILL